MTKSNTPGKPASESPTAKRFTLKFMNIRVLAGSKVRIDMVRMAGAMLPRYSRCIELVAGQGISPCMLRLHRTKSRLLTVYCRLAMAGADMAVITACAERLSTPAFDWQKWLVERH